MDRQYQSPYATLMGKIQIDVPSLLYLFFYFHFKYTNLSIYTNMHTDLSAIKNY